MKELEKMNYKSFYIAILLGIVSLLIFRECGSHNSITKHEEQQHRHKTEIERYRNEVDLLKMENNISKREISRLDSIKMPKVELLYQYKYITQTVRIKDTFRQRFTDSNYCKNIEVENIKLWDVYGIDSVLIVNYKKVVANQDSIIKRDSAMLDICEGAWKREEKERRKSDAKLHSKSFWLEAWRGIAIGAVVVLTYIGLSK